MSKIKEISKTVERVLKKEFPHYYWDDDKKSFNYGVHLGNALEAVQCSVIIDEDFILFLSLADKEFEIDNRMIYSELEHLVCLANEKIYSGKFIIPSTNTGSIMYTTYLPISKRYPSADIILDMITEGPLYFEEYGNAISKVIFGWTNGEDALLTDEFWCQYHLEE